MVSCIIELIAITLKPLKLWAVPRKAALLVRRLRISISRGALSAACAPHERNQMAQYAEFILLVHTMRWVCWLSQRCKFLLKAGKWWGWGRCWLLGRRRLSQEHAAAIAAFISSPLRLAQCCPRPENTHTWCAHCAQAATGALLFINRTLHWDKDYAELWISGWVDFVILCVVYCMVEIILY